MSEAIVTRITRENKIPLTKKTAKAKTTKVAETVEKFVYKEFDPYAVFATVTILAKEECVWHLENILESCRRKMVATEAYRNRWISLSHQGET